ncbi:MAG: Ig-like domain-containing protein, partial [Candidatus Magasanikbacteria bacterium]|nr:Ig-like domain-containing protein [Candidatus Magasanikbacteria bacterium]
MNYLKNFFSKQHLLRTALMISVASFVGIAISFGVIMFARAVAPTPSVNGGIPDGATDVPISTFVAVHFDNGPLDMTTVSTTSVILQANTGNTQGGAPTGPNFCLSAMLVESSSTIMCEHMSDNIPLTTSTWYTLTITTSTANLSAEYLANPVVTTFQTGNFDMNNNTTPPFVQNSVPQPGDSGFAINGNLLVTFPGGDQGNMATSGPGSVTSTANISLETVVNMVPSGTNICASGGCVLTWDGTNHILKINPASDLSQNADYVLILRKEITNVAGVALQGGQQDD